MSGTSMTVEKGDHGLFFALPVDIARDLGLSEGDDVTVRATVDGNMDLARVREGAEIELIAGLVVHRRGERAPHP